MDRGEHPARLKGLGRHKTLNVIGEYRVYGAWRSVWGASAEWRVV